MRNTSLFYEFINTYIRHKEFVKKRPSPGCGCWNQVSVNRIFVEQPYPEPKVKVFIPIHELLLNVRNARKPWQNSISYLGL